MTAIVSPAARIGREVTLDDRYSLDQGPVLMTGVQAIVRLIFDQMSADRDANLNTAAFVSGYQGSPLGGLDLELARQRERCEELGVVHQPALNEELGATSVWGSQLAPGLPGAEVDGVLGVWYGKAPGVDRSADALRHGNHVGAHPRGGLIAICGDDPWCKSSTLPCASEDLLSALHIPVLYPGSPQEVLELGRHAIALSRASGLCVALKVVANVADAVGTVDLDRAWRAPVEPVPAGVRYRHTPSAELLPPASLELERTLRGPRRALATAYAAANGLNGVVLDAPGATLGIVSAGAPYYELREAFRALDLDEDELRARKVRLLKLDVLWPLDREQVRAFADGLDEILVLEEKGSFLEDALRALLYEVPSRPRLVGERDEDGAPLVSPLGGLGAERIAQIVAPRVLRGEGEDAVLARLARTGERGPELAAAPSLSRTPYFCSGCPHNRSTEAPDDALVGAGVGCHGMITLFPKGRGQVAGITQMGGEGAQWIGQAPFTSTPHLIQNLGDGTFTHSGSLAIRAAVAAGVNITYKLLYNDAVAMTGGQDVQGSMSVPDLTHWLELEGVSKVIVTTDDVSRHRGAKLSEIARIEPRERLSSAQCELRETDGVTVLIHDQGCAAEKRRLRKRGKLPDPPERIAINERVCEGCGDCGRKSHCLSLLSVDTEFGRKTRIQQSSCNKDYSCIDGDCPSFLEIVPGKGAPRSTPPAAPSLPDPEIAAQESTLRLIGVGGTGVVTVAQVLAMAALLDGKRTAGLDQTGLAQKGGPVVSDLRIFADKEPHSGRVGRAGADAYVAFDTVGATAPANLATSSPERTVAIVSTSEIPTGQMIGDPAAAFPLLEQTTATIDRVTRAEENVYLDAMALSETLFGDHMAANSIVLGATWQRGLIPISLASIEQAYRINGVAAERNISAFGWGRAVVAAPDSVASLTTPPLPAETADPQVTELVAATGAQADSELGRLLAHRLGDLCAYQGRRYATTYAEFVAGVLRSEAATGGGSLPVTTAVARHLHKLMAYKDEYEVARLHLDPVERERIAAEFGPDARVRYLLHPPLLRALGMRRKLKLGPWFDPAFRLLRRLRFLRGTPFDPFGYARVRRTERALPGEYRGLVELALPHIVAVPDLVQEVCELPDLIRGYEEVKLGNVETFRQRAEELRAQLADSAGTATGSEVASG